MCQGVHAEGGLRELTHSIIGAGACGRTVPPPSQYDMSGSFAAVCCLQAYTEPCRLPGMDKESGSAARPGGETPGGSRPVWEAVSVRALRRHLDLTQGKMAEELGTRQQTVSEWETGLYRPRGTSARLLTIIAERAGFQYGTGKSKPETGEIEQRDDSRS